MTITVGKLAMAGVTLPEDVTLDAYCTTADEVTPQLPTAVTYTGADGKTYTLPAEWSCATYNASPDSASTFTWTVAAEQANFEFAEGVVTTGTIQVTNGTAMAVSITGTDAALTYDGSIYDVRGMFAIDENAGAATYAIVEGGTGAGTLEGSVLTITKAGTITIQVNTAVNMVENMPYAPGEAIAILTVSKGTLNVTAPTRLTATHGQTLQEISLSDFVGWAWKNPTGNVGDAGDNTHTAVFTPDNTNLWNTAEADVNITVVKADIELTGVVKTYLVTEEGEKETAVFTYGDTITVKVAPVMPMLMVLTDELAKPLPNQMALYSGSTQISAPADAVDGVYTLIYQTTDKALTTGENEILVKYIGTDNLNSGMMNLKVTINPAELSIADVAVKSRP